MKTQIERAEPSRGAPDAAHTPGPWHVDDTPGDTVHRRSRLLTQMGAAWLELIEDRPKLLRKSRQRSPDRSSSDVARGK
jgi:hypothetical protein